MTNFVFFHFMLIASTATWIAVSVAVARRSHGNGTPLALHPLFLAAIFVFLVMVDFWVLYSDVAVGREVSFSRRGITELSKVTSAVMIYTILLMTAAAGLFFGAAAAPHRRPEPKQVPGAQRAALLTFLIVLAATLTLFTPLLIGALNSGNVFSVAASRTVIGSESPILALCLLTLTPAALFYASRASSLRAGLGVIGLAVGVFLLFGSRFNIIILLYGALLLSPIRHRASILSVIMAVPVVLLLLSFYAFITRFTYAYDSYGEYLAASGGFFSSTFRSVEMSIAEAMTVHLSERLADREWYESLLAGAVALIPRELIPWKPLGLSTELTMAADPARWILVRSEWTVGGFTNLAYEMGLFGASLAAFTFFVAVGYVTRLIHLSNKSYVFAFPLLLIVILLFFRADMYTAAIRLWSVAFFFALLGTSLLLTRPRSRARVSRPLPAKPRPRLGPPNGG